MNSITITENDATANDSWARISEVCASHLKKERSFFIKNSTERTTNDPSTGESSPSLDESDLRSTLKARMDRYEAYSSTFFVVRWFLHWWWSIDRVERCLLMLDLKEKITQTNPTISDYQERVSLLDQAINRLSYFSPTRQNLLDISNQLYSTQPRYLPIFTQRKEATAELRSVLQEHLDKLIAYGRCQASEDNPQTRENLSCEQYPKLNDCRRKIIEESNKTLGDWFDLRWEYVEHPDIFKQNHAGDTEKLKLARCEFPGYAASALRDTPELAQDNQLLYYRALKLQLEECIKLLNTGTKDQIIESLKELYELINEGIAFPAYIATPSKWQRITGRWPLAQEFSPPKKPETVWYLYRRLLDRLMQWQQKPWDYRALPELELQQNAYNGVEKGCFPYASRVLVNIPTRDHGTRYKKHEIWGIITDLEMCKRTFEELDKQVNALINKGYEKITIEEKFFNNNQSMDGFSSRLIGIRQAALLAIDYCCRTTLETYGKFGAKTHVINSSDPTICTEIFAYDKFNPDAARNFIKDLESISVDIKLRDMPPCKHNTTIQDDHGFSNRYSDLRLIFAHQRLGFSFDRFPNWKTISGQIKKLKRSFSTEFITYRQPVSLLHLASYEDLKLADIKRKARIIYLYADNRIYGVSPHCLTTVSRPCTREQVLSCLEPQARTGYTTMPSLADIDDDELVLEEMKQPQDHIPAQLPAYGEYRELTPQERETLEEITGLTLIAYYKKRFLEINKIELFFESQDGRVTTKANAADEEQYLIQEAGPSLCTYAKFLETVVATHNMQSTQRHPLAEVIKNPPKSSSDIEQIQEHIRGAIDLINDYNESHPNDEVVSIYPSDSNISKAAA